MSLSDIHLDTFTVVLSVFQTYILAWSVLVSRQYNVVLVPFLWQLQVNTLQKQKLDTRNSR